MRKNISKVVSMSIVLLPILHQYRSPIPGITLGELLTIILLPFLLYYFRLKKNKILIPFLFIFLFFLGALFFILVSSFVVKNINYFNAITGIIRGFFYFFAVFVYLNSVFDFNIFFKLYKNFVIITTLYLLIQFIVHFFMGIVLPWTIPFLSVYQDNYGQIDFNQFFTDFYRPYSIFLEPGYYSQYVIPFLTLSILDKNYQNFRMAILVTVGLIFSTSGQGLIIGFLIWLVWVMLEMKKRPTILIGGASIFGIITLFLVRIEFVKRSFLRLFGSENTSSNSRILAPINSFFSLSIKNKVWGIGYNNVESVFGNLYLNSISYILISTGVVGFMFVLSFFVSSFILLKNNMSKVLLIIYFMLMCVGGIFTGLNTLFYILIIFSVDLSRKEKINEKFT